MLLIEQFLFFSMFTHICLADVFTEWLWFHFRRFSQAQTKFNLELNPQIHYKPCQYSIKDDSLIQLPLVG